MTKAQMIDSIIGLAKQSQMVQGSTAIQYGNFFDSGDLFFTLAFASENSLKKICKKLGIKKLTKNNHV